MTDETRPDADRAPVAIIGGGFTGLAAAERLVAAGVRVDLYEAGECIGGLAAGFSLAGHPIEKAYHFLYRTDDHIRELAVGLGLDDRLEFHPSSISTYYDGVLYPMMTPLDLLRFKPLRLHDRLRAGVTLLAIGRIKNWQRLTTVTALDYLNRWAGRSVTKVIWEPLLRGKFDHYYDDVTMGWLWGRIKQRVETREKGESGERLGYFQGGFAVVVDALEERILAGGGTITTDCPIAAIERLDDSDDGQADRDLVVRTAAGDETRYGQVLVTTPSPVFARLVEGADGVTPQYLDQLRSIEYLSAALLVFVSEQEITPFYWHNINTPDAPFVVFLSLTALVGTESFDGQHVYYIGDYVPDDHPYISMTEEELADRWYAELATIFPDFDRSAIVDDAVFRFKDAQHIVDVGYESKIPDFETPLEGVYLANFSQIFPMDRGTNNAVRDGRAIADRMLGERQGATGPAAGRATAGH